MNIVITGGAGFIGSNTAKYFLDKGANVLLFDNLSRAGSKKNLSWLEKQSRRPLFIRGDITKNRDILALEKFIKKSTAVIHLAAQVAVTSSVYDPQTDFEINARGTFNILEVMRKTQTKAKLLYSSTNKVYGEMMDTPVSENSTRYMYASLPHGVSETNSLDFHSPYGCSKGAADQYVHDYSRIYGLDSVVLRQSCIYGPRQFGVEDQGWVAWFIIATMLGKKLSIYGDGKQVRDLLYVDDLVQLYDMVIQKKDLTRGAIYNIGGGIKNTLSVWAEFGPMLESLFGKSIPVTFESWRPGDQKVYVSDITKAKKELHWEPRISVGDGIKKLYSWVTEHKSLFSP